MRVDNSPHPAVIRCIDDVNANVVSHVYGTVNFNCSVDLMYKIHMGTLHKAYSVLSGVFFTIYEFSEERLQTYEH